MKRKLISLTTAVVALLLAGSCSDVNKKTTPVLLIATANQNIQVIDFADTNCGDLGTIVLQSIVKRTDVADTRLLAVQLQKMRVSYARTDGGTLIPQPFVQTISGILGANSSGTTLNDFIIFEPNAFELAPFVALLPENGGVDPETGQPFVKMDVIVEIFGETLSGENVAATARFPLTFCINCGGCR